MEDCYYELKEPYGDLTFVLSKKNPPNGRCSECLGELVFDPGNGERACSSCGMVAPEVYEVWEPGVRVGVSPRSEPGSNMTYEMQLHTLVGKDNVDASGRMISGGYEMGQLRRLNNITITRDSETSNEMKAMVDIDRIVDALGFPANVKRQAQEIYHRGLKAGAIRGKVIVNMAAASVLIAASMVGVPCSLEEMQRAVEDVSPRAARRYYRLLIRTMNIRIETANPTLHVSRIASRAGLSVRVERRALEILSLVKESPSLTDKRPVSLAGAALYMASIDVGERINQLRLAYATGITPITIRKRSSDISRVLSSIGEARSLLNSLREEEREEPAAAESPPVTTETVALEEIS